MLVFLSRHTVQTCFHRAPTRHPCCHCLRVSSVPLHPPVKQLLCLLPFGVIALCVHFNDRELCDAGAHSIVFGAVSPIHDGKCSISKMPSVSGKKTNGHTSATCVTSVSLRTIKRPPNLPASPSDRRRYCDTVRLDASHNNPWHSSKETTLPISSMTWMSKSNLSQGLCPPSPRSFLPQVKFLLGI